MAHVPGRSSRNFARVAIGLVGVGSVLRLIKFLQNESAWPGEAMVAINLGSRSFSSLLEPLYLSQLDPVPAAEADNLMPWLPRRPWLLLNHQRPGEPEALLGALTDRGVVVDSIDATRWGSLWRLRASPDSGHTPSADTTSSMVPQR